MPAKDLSPQQNLVAAFAPAAQTATVTGADIDLHGYDSATVCVHPGTRTDGTHTPKIQEADDNGSGAAGSYADVAAGDQVGTFAAIASNTIQKVAYKGNKKWLRVVVTVSGATTGAVYGATVIRSVAGKNPVA